MRDSLAALHARQGRFDQARSLYEAVLKKSPRNQGALARLAAVYEHEKKWPEARKQYTRLLDLDWTNLDAHMAIAGTYMAEENLDSAIGEFQKVVSKNPKHWDAWKALGRAQERNKDWRAPSRPMPAWQSWPRRAPTLSLTRRWSTWRKASRTRRWKAAAKPWHEMPPPRGASRAGEEPAEESAAEARKHYLEACAPP